MIVSYFCRATSQECQAIQRILVAYEEASGQQLNRSKTTLFFSKNVPQATSMGDIRGISICRNEIKQYEKYLGLPSFVGRGKKASLLYIKEWV